MSSVALTMRGLEIGQRLGGALEILGHIAGLAALDRTVFPANSSSAA